jgi:hypothetical protein
MLNKGLSQLTNRVREQFGVPVTLRRFLADHAQALQVPLESAPQGLFLGSVPRWHEWGQARQGQGDSFQAGEVWGWQRVRHFGWRAHRRVLPDLAGFGSCTRTPRWQCELQDVVGLQASKSELAKFDSLDALAQQGARSHISEISRSRLSALLAHRDLRFLRQPKASEHLVRHLWDGRLFLANAGGTQRFAAARYIAGRIGLAVPLGAELRRCSIEPLAVSGLRRGFELFAVSTREPALAAGLHEALRRLRAPYCATPLPAPYTDAQALFLPREDKRSMAAAAELRAAGLPDLGKHLSALVLRQHMNLVRQGESAQPLAA